MTWAKTRLKHLCVDAGQYGLNISANDYASTGRRLIRTSDIDEMGWLRTRESAVFVDAALDARHELQAGDLLLSRSGTLGRAMLLQEIEEPSTYAGYLVRFRPLLTTEPRFLAYVAASRGFQAAIEADAVTSTIQNFNAERYANIEVLAPPLDEQRRIADFLDAETARLDRIVSIRQRQSALHFERFSQLLDGVVMGDGDALATIGHEGDPRDWTTGKVARLFAIIPGFAFASDEFVAADMGARLLRGINVAPGQIDWSAETVGWDLDSSPVDQRFHLRLGDLVVGMDRPWIGTGTRVALIAERDLPSLLLQRVACIRPRSKSTTQYLRWVLASSHFKFALESETTGVSVPHISGEQIGAFTYRLPKPDEQEVLAALLDAQQQAQTAQAELVDRQLAVLAERRQALISAAVTGEITV